MENQNSRSENVAFLTISEFKAKLGKADKPAQVVKNPNTGKLFLAVEDLRFKVQGDIDSSLPMSVLVPDGQLDQACLVNVKNSENNVQFTL